MNDDTLRLRIRDKFLSHQLPTQLPSRTWGGRATHQICAVCDVIIPGMGEIEAESAEIEAESADGQTRFYHVHCYQLLCLERESIGPVSVISPSAS